MTRATAVAHPNIALVKYWGKTDRELNLPATGSLSLTLDIFPTTTTVEVTDDPVDRVVLNGVELSGEESARVRTVLNRVRELAGSGAHAHVTSTNTVPTAAGLASSAAAFAALAKASSVAYGLSLSDAELSRLARRGSGSACRSIFGGLARWNKGTSDETSIAEPLEWSGEPLSMVVAVISSARKKIGSRAGMNHTVETSPYFEGWVSSNAVLLERASRAVHDSMLGAEPPVRYLTGTSFAMIDAVQELREQGIETYASADAGPNVKILCRSREAALVAERLRERIEDVKMHVANAGPGAYLLDEGERPSEA